MNTLPEDVLWYIYKKYWSVHVLDEFFNNYKFIWLSSSKKLKTLCGCDKGAIQYGSNDLWEMIEDHHLLLLEECLNGECSNCKTYGWPCDNMAFYGFRDESIAGLWKN